MSPEFESAQQRVLEICKQQRAGSKIRVACPWSSRSDKMVRQLAIDRPDIMVIDFVRSRVRSYHCEVVMVRSSYIYNQGDCDKTTVCFVTPQIIGQETFDLDDDVYDYKFHEVKVGNAAKFKIDVATDKEKLGALPTQQARVMYVTATQQNAKAPIKLEETKYGDLVLCQPLDFNSRALGLLISEKSRDDAALHWDTRCGHHMDFETCPPREMENPHAFFRSVWKLPFVTLSLRCRTRYHEKMYKELFGELPDPFLVKYVVLHYNLGILTTVTCVPNAEIPPTFIYSETDYRIFHHNRHLDIIRLMHEYVQDRTDTRVPVIVSLELDRAEDWEVVCGGDTRIKLLQSIEHLREPSNEFPVIMGGIERNNCIPIDMFPVNAGLLGSGSRNVMIVFDTTVWRLPQCKSKKFWQDALADKPVKVVKISTEEPNRVMQPRYNSTFSVHLKGRWTGLAETTWKCVSYNVIRRATALFECGFGNLYCVYEILKWLEEVGIQRKYRVIDLLNGVLKSCRNVMQRKEARLRLRARPQKK